MKKYFLKLTLALAPIGFVVSCNSITNIDRKLKDDQKDSENTTQNIQNELDKYGWDNRNLFTLSDNNLLSQVVSNQQKLFYSTYQKSIIAWDKDQEFDWADVDYETTTVFRANNLNNNYFIVNHSNQTEPNYLISYEIKDDKLIIYYKYATKDGDKFIYSKEVFSQIFEFKTTQTKHENTTPKNNSSENSSDKSPEPKNNQDNQTENKNAVESEDSTAHELLVLNDMDGNVGDVFDNMIEGYIKNTKNKEKNQNKKEIQLKWYGKNQSRSKPYLSFDNSNEKYALFYVKDGKTTGWENGYIVNATFNEETRSLILTYQMGDKNYTREFIIPKRQKPKQPKDQNKDNQLNNKTPAPKDDNKNNSKGKTEPPIQKEDEATDSRETKENRENTGQGLDSKNKDTIDSKNSQETNQGILLLNNKDQNFGKIFDDMLTQYKSKSSNKTKFEQDKIITLQWYTITTKRPVPFLSITASRGKNGVLYVKEGVVAPWQKDQKIPSIYDETTRILTITYGIGEQEITQNFEIPNNTEFSDNALTSENKSKKADETQLTPPISGESDIKEDGSTKTNERETQKNKLSENSETTDNKEKSNAQQEVQTPGTQDSTGSTDNSDASNSSEQANSETSKTTQGNFGSGSTSEAAPDTSTQTEQDSVGSSTGGSASQSDSTSTNNQTNSTRSDSATTSESTEKQDGESSGDTQNIKNEETNKESIPEDNSSDSNTNQINNLDLLILNTEENFGKTFDDMLNTYKVKKQYKPKYEKNKEVQLQWYKGKKSTKKFFSIASSGGTNAVFYVKDGSEGEFEKKYTKNSKKLIAIYDEINRTLTVTYEHNGQSHTQTVTIPHAKTN